MKSHRTSLAALPVLFLASLFCGSAHAAVYPCFIAFIHGAGHDDVDAPDTVVTDPMVRGAATSYWWPEGQDIGYSFLESASRQWMGTGGQCNARVIRYNSTGDVAFSQAVAPVAAELNAFIEEAGIASNQLIVVTHSMGGLVMRFLLNTASPGNRFFPGWNGDHRTILDRTKYVITVQAPHTGTRGADALDGRSNSDFANDVARLTIAFGFRESNNQTKFMTTTILQPASAPGGWLGDSFRTKPIFTIGGTSAGSDSGEANCVTDPTNDDCLLNVAWRALYGGSTSGGDGLVERDSAHAWNPSVANWTAGIYTWLDGAMNHNHGRYSFHVTNWADRIDQTGAGPWRGTPASMIGVLGLDLPRSAAEHTSE